MNFYEEKPLSDFTDEEWESICMRCGKCCMCKYSGDGFIHFSNYMCRFFDTKNGKCSCYDRRFEVAKDDCKKVSLELLETELELLPPSCAYRRLYEGKGLPEYHPLRTGNPKSAEQAGQTVKSLPVLAENRQEEEIFELLHTAFAQHWSEVRIMQKVAEIRKKFELKWLESYPLTGSVKKTAC